MAKTKGDTKGGTRPLLADEREELQQLRRERLDLLFDEARSYEYMVLNEASRVEMQQIMTKMAGGGWEPIHFTAFPDPAYPKARNELKPDAHMDVDSMDNLAVIYVALMRRGGQIRKK